MHRGRVLEQMQSCTHEELQAWKKHVLYCLDVHRKDRNAYEIEECEFLLEHLNVHIVQRKD